MKINLDKNFDPFAVSSLVEFESFTFMGGEPHIKISSQLNADETVFISHRINSFNDFGLLLMAIDACKKMGIKNIEVCIPYFPGARQDRLMTNGEPLTVKVYADILNHLQLKKVHIFDPHSDVTSALLENCNVIKNYTFIQFVLKEIGENVLLVSPDGGALKKIYNVSAAAGNLDVVECSKSRNVNTGKLTNFKVMADDLQQKNCLIVDDICDGGATFTGLANELKNKNAGKLFLAVSHGIFSKGLEELCKHFEIVFCTNSIKDIRDNRVKLYVINELI